MDNFEAPESGKMEDEINGKTKPFLFRSRHIYGEVTIALYRSMVQCSPLRAISSHFNAIELNRIVNTSSKTAPKRSSNSMIVTIKNDGMLSSLDKIRW
jgi:hypothetical protein